jgi:hypothetical protein
MTVNTTQTQVAFTGDGATTALPVPFIFFGANELRVVQRTIATGAETTLVLGVNYTVTGGNGSIGTVTMTVAPGAEVQIFIIRNTTRTQLTDYVPNDPFPADAHERALDRLTAITQELGSTFDRAVLVPETETSIVLPPSADRATKYLAFDVNGKFVPAVPPGSAAVTPFMQTVLASSDASQARDTIDAARAEWLHLKDFGAVGDGVADDTAAINAWITEVLATGKPGYFGAGHFRYTGTQFLLNIGGLAATQGGALIGAGGSRTILDVTACTGTPQFLVRCQSNFLFYWTFKGFEVRGNRDGVMAQWGRDWDGSAYPDALNSCTIHDVIFRNNSGGTNAVAVRYNLVLDTNFHTVANCGSNANLNGIAHELVGVQFSTGKLTGGNSQYAIAFRRFTFGNSFNGELAVCRHVALVDSNSGWNRLAGNFGWGAASANPAISGTDTTTTAIVATTAGAPLVFGHESNWAATPTITGAGAGNIWIQNRGIGIQLAEGWRLKPESTTSDPSVLFIPATGRSGWVQFFRGGSPDTLRWLAGMNNVNNLVVQRYNSSGVFQDTPWFINEANGLVTMLNAIFTNPPRIPAYTFAGLPAASAHPRGMAQVTDRSNRLAISDGAAWRYADDGVIVS